ncbi:MAG: MurR/RpiR family transcriptional regulator, partial [Lachnospiraceae bacterium]|nr:MurR/RpiR family transcriptional regulator [Lachnospiraceae bacterium]
MYLMQKIEDVAVGSDDAKKNVASFILNNYDRIFEYTIDDIARESFTSKSTVTRFAKYLDFSGWRDFLKAFIAEVKIQEKYKDSVDVNYPFSEESSDKE